MTHAKNLFYRRVANRRPGGNPDKGKPIEGELTPVEIAKKSRRRLRWIQIKKEILFDTEQRLNAIEAALKMFRKNTDKQVDRSKEIKELEVAKQNTLKEQNKAKEQLKVLLA